jgi:hypothetical protein
LRFRKKETHAVVLTTVREIKKLSKNKGEKRLVIKKTLKGGFVEGGGLGDSSLIRCHKIQERGGWS